MRRSGRLAQRLHAMSSRLRDACYFFQPVRQRFRRPQSHQARNVAGQVQIVGTLAQSARIQRPRAQSLWSAGTSKSACDLRRSDLEKRGIDLVASQANWYQTTGFSNQSAGIKAFTA